MTLLLVLITQPLAGSQTLTTPAVDATQLAAHVKHLSVDLHPRGFDQFENLEATAAYVEKMFRRAGVSDVSSQPVKVQGATYRNVIARLGPRDGPVLVIGAHMDSHGTTPGADDNASGVAGLIELARLLAASKPSRAVELVAYTLEEPPHFRTEHMGSAHHARSLKASGRELSLMVSLEMIGTFKDEAGSQRYPLPGMSWLYGDRGDFIAIVNRFGDFGATRRAKALMSGATSLPVRSINAPAMVPGVDFSDHLSYWRLGMPALMVTDTAFMRNDHYHQTGDTFDELDYKRMAQVVEAVFALALTY